MRPTVGANAMKASLLLLLLAFIVSPVVRAQGGWESNGPAAATEPSNGKPAMLRDVGIEQRLNEQLPLDLPFRDESGREVKLGEYFGKRPVVLALVYYSCPMLCNQVLEGLAGALTTLKFDAGKEFDVVAVSFDAREKPALAEQKKETFMKWYKRPGADAGWHFLVGDQPAIDSLTRAVGFRYAFDAARNQFAHASGIMLVTPEGKLARYFYGVEYAPQDIQLGLVEASENKIGSRVDQLLLYCYHYDPTTGRYAPVVINFIRLGGIITVVGLLALILLLKRRVVQTGPVDIGGTA